MHYKSLQYVDLDLIVAHVLFH